MASKTDIIDNTQFWVKITCMKSCPLNYNNAKKSKINPSININLVFLPKNMDF